MTRRMSCLAVLAGLWAVLGAGTLRAADEVILGSKILIKDPTSVEDKRQVKGAGKESATSLPAVLAQPGAGATLTVVTAGTTPGEQTFALTGTWAAAGSSGWKYISNREPQYAITSAVKSLLLKRTSSGTAQLKVGIKGNVGYNPLNLVPPNLGTEAGVILDDGNGTRYCVRLGGAAGGVVKKNDATQFQLVANGTAPAIEAGCPSTCFQDLGDGTIRDTCSTNLQWEKKDTPVESGVNAVDLHDVDNPYSWAGTCSINTSVFCQPNAAAAATCAVQTGGALGCGQCGVGDGTCNVDPFEVGAITTVWDWINLVNAANFAGHSDWRLPSEDGCNSCDPGYPAYSCPCSPNELESILLASQVPPINAMFGPTGYSSYWSASTSATSPTSAWFVSFGNGPMGYVFKGGGAYVRAVRPGS